MEPMPVITGAITLSSGHPIYHLLTKVQNVGVHKAPMIIISPLRLDSILQYLLDSAHSEIAMIFVSITWKFCATPP